jgi:hypothetical protein
MLNPYLVLATALSLSLLACGQDRETLESGDVLVQWAVGPYGCVEAGTQAVLITSSSVVGSMPEAGWTVGCEERRTLLTNIPPGVYEFSISAVSPSGQEWFSGTTGEVQVRPAGLTTVQPVVLESEPADYAVVWNFGDKLCPQANVAQVNVMAFDDFGTLEVGMSADCNDGVVRTSIRPGLYDVVIHALATDDTLVSEKVLQVELGRGESRTDEVLLDVMQAP